MPTLIFTCPSCHKQICPTIIVIVAGCAEVTPVLSFGFSDTQFVYLLLNGMLKRIVRISCSSPDSSIVFSVLSALSVVSHFFPLYIKIHDTIIVEIQYNCAGNFELRNINGYVGKFASFFISEQICMTHILVFTTNEETVRITIVVVVKP